MSIELKEAAQQALKELGEARKIVRASSSRQLAKDWDRRATDALANLRAAIQQAEAQQPATGKPVWCVATGERVNGEETFTHHDAYVPLADCFPLYTHQAPSVPDDMVRDAERYRYLRDIRRRDAIVLSGPEAGVWCDAEDEDGTLLLLTEDDLDAAIDAATLAAKERS